MGLVVEDWLVDVQVDQESSFQPAL
jgi:hypothetical protein